MAGESASRLTISLLGELTVSRGGVALPLPPSKKTRALLGYLVLTGRSHRRDTLAGLLWDVADDRRGALRWSLSKLRAILDEDGAERVVADRDSVCFRAEGALVDAVSLRSALARARISEMRTEQLAELAGAFRGELLEGLDLADFDDYQAWCVAEREEARGWRARILCELVGRLQAEPAAALEHARAWVQVDPLDERARASLVRLLAALGRRDEARQHYEAGRRIERELGRKGQGELAEAWKAVSAAKEAQGPPSPAVHEATPSQRAPRSEPRELPLVGREADVGALHAALRGVQQNGEPSVLLVMGEPGLGKTRLLRAFAEAAGARAGVHTLYGAAFEADSGNPYGAWSQALGQLPTERATDRDRFFASVIESLAARAHTNGTVILMLDDVQWLDPGSSDLLFALIRARRIPKLLVVLAVREGEVGDNSGLLRALRGLRRDGLVREHPLRPLDRDAVVALVRLVDPNADAARIFAEGAGNALYSLELARAEDREGVPSSLTALVRDRLALLPHEAADVLRWAAVLGAAFSVDQLHALSSLELRDVLAALELLEAKALLRAASLQKGADGFTFSHELVRRVVYTDVSEPRRRLMHRRVAELLSKDVASGDAAVAEVAHHATLAHDAALAAETCIAAARRCLRLFASADALALSKRALRHASELEDPERTKLQIEATEIAFSARRPDDVAASVRTVHGLAERALDLGAFEHARLGFHLLGYLSWESGEWTEARRHMMQAEAASRGGSEPERVTGMAEAARCLVLLERDLGQAQALALEAAARARQIGLETPGLFDALGMLEVHQGRLDEAALNFERSRTLAHTRRLRHDEFQALEHHVMLELEREAPKEALRMAKELAELGERFREGSEAPFAHALVALAAIALGEDADAALEAAIEELARADAKHRLAYVLSRAALHDIERGDTGRACVRARRALGYAEILERPTEIALSRFVLQRCAAARGDHDETQLQEGAITSQAAAWVAAPVRALLARKGRGNVEGRRG